jgi:hypothetical protein
MGDPENVYFDISYSPVRDEAGGVEGVLCIVSETTEHVLAQERQCLLFRETNHRLKNLFAMVDAMRTTERHYNRARGIEASRTFSRHC